jgi:hypothetical protein
VAIGKKNFNSFLAGHQNTFLDKMLQFNYFKMSIICVVVLKFSSMVSSFTIKEASVNPHNPELGKPVLLKCRSDSYFEFCIWRHKDRVCEFEWKRNQDAVVKQVRMLIFFIYRTDRMVFPTSKYETAYCLFNWIWKFRLCIVT